MASPSQLDDAGDAVRSVIRAFHGSPHSLDKFDSAFIGSGEGAQAKGYGLYFAGSENTEDFYRKSLSGGLANNHVTPEERARYFEPGRLLPSGDKVLRYHETPGSPWEWSVEVIRSNQDGTPVYGERPRRHRTEPIARDFDRSFGLPPRRLGHMYEVEIAHPESSLMDWDAGLRAQSPEVLGALDRLGLLVNKSDSLTGETAYDNLIGALQAQSGLPEGAAARAASRKLLDAGVPGIKYWDAMSRIDGAGTRNYVMFPGTEDSIRILRKYGLLAPMAAGASVAPDQQ